jgi:hypothetical protein
VNLRFLPLFLFACGPIAVEPGATDSTGVPSTTGTSTAIDASSSSTSASPPADLGEALADLPPPERPADTDRDLRVFVTSSHHRGDKTAGHRRNIDMIEAEQPDVVLGYPDEQSSGTWHCIAEALRRDIPCAVLMPWADGRHAAIVAALPLRIWRDRRKAHQAVYKDSSPSARRIHGPRCAGEHHASSAL